MKPRSIAPAVLVAWGLLLALPACSRSEAPLPAALARLPGDVAFVVRVEPAGLGPQPVVARALAAVAERVGGLERVPVAALLGAARSVLVVRGAAPGPDPRCEQAAAHVADLMRAAAGGNSPQLGDVVATRRACDRLGLADCLLAASTDKEAVACATTRATAGEPWVAVFDGMADADATCFQVAAALGLRAQPGAPRFAEGRWAVHALPGRLVLGQPALVRAIVAAEAAPPTPPADPALVQLARELPPAAPIQAVYRGLGLPPSLQAASLAVTLDDGLAVTWHLSGAAALAAELRAQLEALRSQSESHVALWAAWVGAAAPLPPSDALLLVQAIPVLAGGATFAPRAGGVDVTARVSLDLRAILAHVAEGATPPPAAAPVR